MDTYQKIANDLDKKFEKELEQFWNGDLVEMVKFIIDKWRQLNVPRKIHSKTEANSTD